MQNCESTGQTFMSSEVLKNGKPYTKLVCGVGINDADYWVCPIVNGKTVWCPFYRVWLNLLARCYLPKRQAIQPSYIGCYVCDEWLRFSVFKAWMEQQDWEGNQLDKDLLVPGNKRYGPDTCAFVSPQLNTFTIDRGADRGEWPLGVSWCKTRLKYQSLGSNPFTGKRENLGRFDCPQEAHEAWRRRKHEIALVYAAQQTDPRIAAALSTRYAKEHFNAV